MCKQLLKYTVHMPPNVSQFIIILLQLQKSREDTQIDVMTHKQSEQ